MWEPIFWRFLGGITRARAMRKISKLILPSPPRKPTFQPTFQPVLQAAPADIRRLLQRFLTSRWKTTTWGEGG